MACAEEPDGTTRPRARRLAGARSAYLREAAGQPIDWHPWGEEPFELARRTGRPILLDIGAVWCHWCHVMDDGTYADPEVARLIEQHFVAVKVDRDEHPEVDRRFQRQVGALSGEGGWPLTAFATPEGEVFLGGTYFPPQDGLGRPGFRRVLREVARLYRDEPEKVRQSARSIQEALGRLAARGARPRALDGFVPSVLAMVGDSFDPVNGGFGHAPKFPHATTVELLLWSSLATGEPADAERGRETLLKMADGGVYDQVGGGFHRYSVDEGWHVPHFEKMGRDNAELLHAYAAGLGRFGDARLADTVRGIARWATEVLLDPAGGFGASQDADIAPGDDGSYFTWSRAELRSVLDAEELRFATRLFGVGTDGRMPHDPERNVLFRLLLPSEAAEGVGEAGPLLARVTEKLAAARAARSPPIVDRAVYADINGAFLRGFAAGADALDDPSFLAPAVRAADRFLAAGGLAERGVPHRVGADGPSGFGHLDDNASIALGLTELAGRTLERRYVDGARSLLALLDREFRGDDGLLRDLAPALYDGPSIGGIATPSYPLEDAPHLAANAAAAIAMVRFASLTGEASWRERAASLISAAAGRLGGAGLFGSGIAFAAGLLSTPPARVVIAGDGAPARALQRAARTAYHPDAWVFAGEPPAPFGLPESLAAAAGSEGEARALLCFGTRCLAPVTDPERIAALLRSEGRAP